MIFFIGFFIQSFRCKKAESFLEGIKRKIYCFGASNDEVKYSWSAYNCLYCEIQDDAKQKTYILSNGEWYEIESNFANQVNSDYQKCVTFNRQFHYRLSKVKMKMNTTNQ